MHNKLNYFLISIFNLSNKLVMALFFTLSYYSLYVVLSPYISFFLTIPAFLISLIVAFVFYKLGGNIYKTFFTIKDKETLYDIVITEDKPANNSANYEQIKKRFYLEYNIILATLAYIIFVFTFVVKELTNSFSNIALESVYQNNFSLANILYFSFIVSIVLLGLIYEKAAKLKNGKADLRLYVYFYLLLLFLLTTAFIFLKTFIQISASLL